MTENTGAPASIPSLNRRFAIGLARAFGGALLFSFPMLMTMEMWWLGFHMPPARLGLFMLLVVPLLAALSYYIGIEESYLWKDIILDPFVGYAVGFVTSGVMLLMFSVLETGMSWNEIVGKIALAAVPASIGAMLARSQLGLKAGKELERRSREYTGGLFMMAVGAVFLSFSVSSTEEMILIAYKMTERHVIALAFASLLVIHAFTYAVPPEKEAAVPEGVPFSRTFLRWTITGYAIALVICLYVLWTFGRTDGMSAEQIVRATIVTAFPASLGVAAARIIL